jgi:hypothetical protein
MNSLLNTRFFSGPRNLAWTALGRCDMTVHLLSLAEIWTLVWYTARELNCNIKIGLDKKILQR